MKNMPFKFLFTALVSTIILLFAGDLYQLLIDRIIYGNPSMNVFLDTSAHVVAMLGIPFVILFICMTILPVLFESEFLENTFTIFFILLGLFTTSYRHFTAVDPGVFFYLLYYIILGLLFFAVAASQKKSLQDR